VKTTLDAAWQERLETELNTAVRSLESEKGWPHPTHADYQPGKDGPGYVQFAAVTTETKTGAVLALIGGRDFRHSRLDRSRSERDLGSAIEPFIAAAVSERGKLVLPGKPLQMGRQIGPQEVARIAKRLGLAGPFADSEDLFRGYLAASPRDAATALATIGNDGKRPRLFFIREVKSLTGELLYTGKSDHTQAISENAAKDAGSILKSSAGTKCLTGSTSSERDAWTLRLGPSGATAIWIGFDQPAPIASEARLNSLLTEFVKRLGND
jgi:penicillin-binding protein 1A